MARFPQFSAPQRRSPSDPWFRIGTLEVTSTVFVALLGVVSLFFYAADPALLRNLALFDDGVRSGKVWQLVTWPLYNVPKTSIIPIIVFWYLGRGIEERLGRNRMAGFLGACIVIPAVLETVLVPLFFGPRFGVGGMEILEGAIIAAFGVEMAHTRLFFGIQAWIFAAVILGIDVLQFLGDRNWPALWMLLFVIATAALGLRAMGLAQDAPWLPKIPLPARFGGPPGAGTARRKKTARENSHLRVAPVPGTATPHADQHEIDRLLDKIAASGMASLTQEERGRLDAASRRRRTGDVG